MPSFLSILCLTCSLSVIQLSTGAPRTRRFPRKSPVLAEPSEWGNKKTLDNSDVNDEMVFWARGLAGHLMMSMDMSMPMSMPLNPESPSMGGDDDDDSSPTPGESSGSSGTGGTDEGDSPIVSGGVGDGDNDNDATSTGDDDDDDDDDDDGDSSSATDAPTNNEVDPATGGGSEGEEGGPPNLDLEPVESTDEPAGDDLSRNNEIDTALSSSLLISSVFTTLSLAVCLF